MKIWTSGRRFNLHDSKASHRRECWLGFPCKRPNPLATRQYDVGRPLYDAPTLISLAADVGEKLRHGIKLPAAKLIGMRRVGRDEDSNSNQLKQQDSAVV